MFNELTNEEMMMVDGGLAAVFSETSSVVSTESLLSITGSTITDASLLATALAIL